MRDTSEAPDEPGDAIAKVEQMLASREMDGLVRRLSAKYRDRQSMVDDAVCEAIVRLVQKVSEGRHIENVQAWLYTASDNLMRNAVKRERTRAMQDGEDWPDTERQFETVETQDTLRHFKTIMAGWTETKRVVTTIALEAAVAGDPMTSEELAQAASLVLGREIKPNAARTTRARGIAALAEAYADTDKD